MVLMTSRDEAMLDWLKVVRFADSEAIRWALPAVEFGAVEGPVHSRRAQHWIHRMHELGLIDRDRLAIHTNYIVWASPTVTGRRGPNLFGQTMRHELAVANTSARYLAAGFQWARDRRPESVYDHQVDGIANSSDQIDLVEVELTPKATARYRHILNRLGDRLESDPRSKVVYFCTSEAARAVKREADRYLLRDTRDRFRIVDAFDRHGNRKTPFALIPTFSSEDRWEPDELQSGGAGAHTGAGGFRLDESK